MRLSGFCYSASAIIVAVLLLAACSGHARSTGVPSVPTAQSNQPVAVFGDSQAELEANAQLVEASGHHPIYLTVQAPTTTYKFPVYSQVVRSANALIVWGYGIIYAFPIGSARLRYGTGAVNIDDLPSVKAFVIDRITSRVQPGTFLTGDTATKRHLCPDCSMVLRITGIVRNTVQSWAGLSDPWQKAPEYVAWMPTPPSADPGNRHANFTNIGGGPLSLSCYTVNQFSNQTFYDRYCSPSDTGGFYVGNPQPPTPSGCRNIQVASAQRKTSPESLNTNAEITRLQSYQAKALADIIPNDQIDANIDPQFQGAERQAIHSALLVLPPFARKNVEGIDANGNYFTNRQSLRLAHSELQQPRRLPNGLLVNQYGETVALPNDMGQESLASSSERRTLSAATCAPSGIGTGAYARAASCNVSTTQVTSTVDATLVGPNSVEQNWCMERAGDVGYLLVGLWSSNGNGAVGEGGLQFSTAGPNTGLYELFGNPINGPNGQPNYSSIVFSPDVFTMTYGYSNGAMYTNIQGASGQQGTWMNQTGTLSGPFIYKQEATIAQSGTRLDGSYFGVDHSGNPQFTWSSSIPLACCDQIPDSSRALAIGGRYGINLYPNPGN